MVTTLRQIREFRSSRGSDNFAACVADNCRKLLHATVSVHSSFGFLFRLLPCFSSCISVLVILGLVFTLQERPLRSLQEKRRCAAEAQMCRIWRRGANCLSSLSLFKYEVLQSWVHEVVVCMEGMKREWSRILPSTTRTRECLQGSEVR